MKRIFLVFLLFPAFLLAHPADCTVYFSPKDHLADRLIELIDKEEKAIKIAIYSITHLGIAKALKQAKMRNVNVEILVDPLSIKNKSAMNHLFEAKIPLFVWDKEMQKDFKKGRGLMHDKFCLFGDQKVWTGSFNFTHNADKRHQENAVVLESKELTAQYLAQFSHMKLYESRPVEEYLALHPKKKRRNLK